MTHEAKRSRIDVALSPGEIPTSQVLPWTLAILFSVLWALLIVGTSFSGESSPPSDGAAQASPSTSAPVGSEKVPVQAARQANGEVMGLVPVMAVYTQAEGRPLVKPRGVSVDRPKGEIYVADAGANLVTIYNAVGIPLAAIGMNGELQEPVRAVAAPDGTVYVLNGTPRRLYVASYRGEIRGEFPFRGLAPGEAVQPETIATDAEGRLYVGTGGETAEILVYGVDGRLERRMGRDLTGSAAIRHVNGLAVDRAGNVYALDATSQVPVRVFGPDGRLLAAWGARGRGRGAFSLPAGITVDGSGRVIVVDTLRQSIQIYTPDGEFLGIFGGFGVRSGELLYPADMDSDGQERIFVVEREGRRLQAYREEAGSPARGANAPDTAGEAARARVRAEMQRQMQRIGRPRSP